MYTFLAERFLPYWFKKYTNALEWPVVYCDIKNNEQKKFKVFKKKVEFNTFFNQKKIFQLK